MNLQRLKGRIFHQRFQPLSHRFTYPAWYSASDLSGTHPFDNRRHLNESPTPLLEKARQAAQERGIDCAGTVWMLAQPPFLGIGFNPLSLYYFHDAQGQPSGVILEVRNTPWRERELYALNPDEFDHSHWAKTFHVSPFNPAGQHYEIRAQWPDTQYRCDLLLHQDGQKIMSAGFRLAPIQSPTYKDHIGQACMPLITLGGIYWQALKLWCKGMRYQPYPAELKK